MSLEGRVAVVTGGGRGIGRVIALRLARAGADLVLAGLSADDLASAGHEAEALGRRALPVVTDVAREESVRALAGRALASFGRVDVLVNNAGIIGPTAPVEDVQREDWDEVLAVNLTGAFLCAKAFLPGMKARRSGKVVNVSSIAGKMAYALRAPYAVSKWGLIGLTLTLAREAGPYNVQVNAVCPGPVEGERMARVIEGRARELGQSVEEVARAYAESTLLKRFVRPEDVADLVAFLASPAGGAPVNTILRLSPADLVNAGAA
jgi:NAD(P)-dependent dehydrogenase (short-subunit alcohol dehydrogenase family)